MQCEPSGEGACFLFYFSVTFSVTNWLFHSLVYLYLTFQTLELLWSNLMCPALNFSTGKINSATLWLVLEGVILYCDYPPPPRWEHAFTNIFFWSRLVPVSGHYHVLIWKKFKSKTKEASVTCLSEEVRVCAARILLPFAKEERDHRGKNFLRENGTEGNRVLYRREKLFFPSLYKWRLIHASPLQVWGRGKGAEQASAPQQQPAGWGGGRQHTEPEWAFGSSPVLQTCEQREPPKTSSGSLGAVEPRTNKDAQAVRISTGDVVCRAHCRMKMGVSLVQKVLRISRQWQLTVKLNVRPFWEWRGRSCVGWVAEVALGRETHPERDTFSEPCRKWHIFHEEIWTKKKKMLP